MDPIHEISSFVSGPDFNGVFSDINTGMAKGNHPTAVPCEKNSKLTEISQKILIITLSSMLNLYQL